MTPQTIETEPSIIKWSIGIKPSLKNRLQKVAKMEGRTIYKVLEIALEKWLSETYPAVTA